MDERKLEHGLRVARRGGEGLLAEVFGACQVAGRLTGSCLVEEFSDTRHESDLRDRNPGQSLGTKAMSGRPTDEAVAVSQLWTTTP